MSAVRPAGGGAAHRRAPRLAPSERIASRITRTGRFRAIDPRKSRPLPSVAGWLAFLGWAALLAESFRRAITASRPSPPST